MAQLRHGERKPRDLPLEPVPSVTSPMCTGALMDNERNKVAPGRRNWENNCVRPYSYFVGARTGRKRSR